MAPIFGNVLMLKPGKSTFGLELRLIRFYENTNALSLECIFHDVEGVRVHVTIPKASVEKFKHCLFEGNVYALIDFVVGINVMKYKTTGRLYKIIVFQQTRIFEVFHAEFTRQLYEIKTFNDIAHMENIGDAPMFDVMGTIVSHYRPLTKDINGKATLLMDLILEDLEGNTVTVTLWEAYAEEMVRFLESNPEGPVGVIVQFCRPNLYRGEVRVSSMFNITKIVLNQKDANLAEFNFRYLTSGKVRSTSISTLSSSAKRNLNEEIRDGEFELKTISEFMTDEKLGNFWVYATILCVETIGDWSYLACKRCQKKITRSGNQFFCQKCQTYDIEGKLRYKLTVRVVDDTGTTTFLMWDKECISLLGKTAAELSVGQSHEGIPAGLEHLSNKKALFNISVQPGQTKNYTGSYSVSRICRDREIIKNICGEEIGNEEEDSISINRSEVLENMVGSSSKASVQSKDSEVTTKTVQQILEDGESGEFRLHGTVNCIEGIFGISYLACKVCRKELDVQDKLKFFCEKCHSFDITGKSRHQLTVRVSDSSGSVILRMWDIQCMAMLGKNLDEDDLMGLLPAEVEGICNKKGFFTITVLHEQLNNSRGPFDVVNVVVDDDIIGETEESTGKSKKGKEIVDGIPDEMKLIESLCSPKKINTNSEPLNVLGDDSVRRNLLDEFSATTKRIKRVSKKEKH